jgi:hypothetical protein
MEGIASRYEEQLLVELAISDGQKGVVLQLEN